VRACPSLHAACECRLRRSGTAVYRGVALKKVLKIACGGVKPECAHLEFLGADTYFKKVRVLGLAP
jgi:sulfite oxidase